MYLVELRKLIKNKETKLSELNRMSSSDAFYTETNEEIKNNLVIKPEKTFTQYLEEIKELNLEIATLKSKLRKVNEETLVEDGLTLADALFKLRQTTSFWHHVQRYVNTKERSRSTGYGSDVIEYNVANFVPSEVNELSELMQEEINYLQLAIDRVNMITEIQL